MSDISKEAERLKNQRDYNRRLADHQATVIDKLNAHITGLSARIEALETALKVYAEPCDGTETTDCGYEGNMCCKTARETLEASK